MMVAALSFLEGLGGWLGGGLSDSLRDIGGIDRWGAALGWAVFSFLWQGLLIGILCATALRLIPRSSPGARYAVAGGGLALSVLVFCATAVLSSPSPERGGALGGLLAGAGYLEADLGAALMSVGAVPTEGDAGLRWIPAVAALWALGALWMTLRLVFACGAAHRLRVRSRIAVDDRWQAVADRLCVDLGIRRRVRVFATELADSPLVVGWLRPVVLVPTATFLVLSAEQLRSVLAHELAHIRRFDPLFNALQAIVEVLLFFHPATWWLSSVIRQEREHCCDLAAVRTTGGPLPLARALTRLESHRQTSSEVVLAARPKPGFLMTRIQRILDVRSSGQPKRASLRPLTLLGTVAVALGLGIASAAANPQPDPAGPTTLSLEGRDAHGDYSIVEARILEAVEAQALSASDANNVLKALRKSMFDDKVMGKDQLPRRVRLLPPVIAVDQLPSAPRIDVEGRYESALKRVYELEGKLREVKSVGNSKSVVMGKKRAALEEQLKEYKEYKAKIERQSAYLKRLDPSMPRVGDLFDPATDPRQDMGIDAVGEVPTRTVRGVESRRRIDEVRGQREAQRKIVEGQRAALDSYRGAVKGRHNPAPKPVAVGSEVRRGGDARGKSQGRARGKAQGDEAQRLTDRLRVLEMELKRVQVEANKASREVVLRGRNSEDPIVEIVEEPIVEIVEEPITVIEVDTKKATRGNRGPRRSGRKSDR